MNRTTMVSSTAALIAGIAIGSVGIAFGGAAQVLPAQPSFTSALTPVYDMGQGTRAQGATSRPSTPPSLSSRPSDDVRPPAPMETGQGPQGEAGSCVEHEDCRVDHLRSPFQIQTQAQARVQTQEAVHDAAPVHVVQHEQSTYSANVNQTAGHSSDGTTGDAPHDGSHDGRGDHDQ